MSENVPLLCQNRKKLRNFHKTLNVFETVRQDSDQIVNWRVEKTQKRLKIRIFLSFTKIRSVNEVICHGIPDARVLENGDILNLDVTVYYKGYHGDLNETYCVFEKSPKIDNIENDRNLIKVTHDALMNVISKLEPGFFIRDVGKSIEPFVKKHGFQVVKTFVYIFWKVF